MAKDRKSGSGNRASDAEYKREYNRALRAEIREHEKRLKEDGHTGYEERDRD